jgi:hypothetical protein
MLSVYLNYPMSRVSIHRDPDCGFIRVNRKPNQRIRRIDMANISEELRKFRDRQYPFQSTPEFNDMWLEIDFGDQEFEVAVARYVHRLLSEYHKPFADSSVSIHC